MKWKPCIAHCVLVIIFVVRSCAGAPQNLTFLGERNKPITMDIPASPGASIQCFEFISAPTGQVILSNGFPANGTRGDRYENTADTGYGLAIKNLSYDDGGNYECIIHVGSFMTTVQINILVIDNFTCNGTEAHSIWLENEVTYACSIEYQGILPDRLMTWTGPEAGVVKKFNLGTAIETSQADTNGTKTTFKGTVQYTTTFTVTREHDGTTTTCSVGLLNEEPLMSKITGRLEVKVASCHELECKNGAYCIEGSGKCTCEVGFKGNTCEHAIGCADVTCENGAPCLTYRSSYLNGVFYCNCTEGYEGSFCESRQTEPPPLPLCVDDEE